MVEPKPSGVRPRALPSAALLCSVLFFLPGVFADPIIDGVECANVVVVAPNGCDPDYDEEGMVCANDDMPDEAYCSYDVGDYACARCAPCADANSNCGDWASYGECQNNPGYMLSNCMLSCGVCAPTEPPASWGCKVGDGAIYRDSASTTTDGLQCQNWTVQVPHTHTHMPSNYPDSGLGDHNFVATRTEKKQGLGATRRTLVCVGTIAARSPIVHWRVSIRPTHFHLLPRWATRMAIALRHLMSLLGQL